MDKILFWKAHKKAAQHPLYQQYANTAADAFSNPAMTGWLTKQGSVHKTWHKRYFVLEGTALIYYDSEKAKQPKGVFPLAGCEAMRDMTRGKKHCFQISRKKLDDDDADTARVFILYGKKEDNIKAWIKAINNAVNHHSNSNTNNNDDEDDDESGDHSLIRGKEKAV